MYVGRGRHIQLPIVLDRRPQDQADVTLVRVTRRRIEVPVIERPDQLLLRVSHHFYTTEAEIDTLAAALREIL